MDSPLTKAKQGRMCELLLELTVETLQLLDPEQRAVFMSDLINNDAFCTKCGSDLAHPGAYCHCENDE